MSIARLLGIGYIINYLLKKINIKLPENISCFPFLQHCRALFISKDYFPRGVTLSRMQGNTLTGKTPF